MIRNEETSFELTVKSSFAGILTTPATARYKIKCLTTNRSIRDWTELTPASEMTIDVTPDDNVIINSSDRTERRQLQIQTDYDTDTQKVGFYEWDVRNLS